MRLSVIIGFSTKEDGDMPPVVTLTATNVRTDDEVRNVINIAEQVIEIIRELDPSQRV